MNLALVHSRARTGVRAPEVRVEVHLGGGLPTMSIVGLPEAAVREAKDRVRAAMQCAQFEFPQRRITVNLAPADLPKGGGRFDLPIALGILAASGQIPLQALGEYEFLGELGLTGELRVVDGVLPAALAAADAGRKLIVPAGNGAEAALASQVEAYTARTLLEVCAMLSGSKTLPAERSTGVRQEPAGLAPAWPAAGCQRGGGAGIGRHRLDQRAWPGSGQLAGAAVPRAPPHRQRGGPGGWRRRPAPRRDLTGPPRCALPRRAARVGAPCTGGVA